MATVTRRHAREWAVQMLVAADLNPPENLDEFIASCREEIASENPEQASAIARGALSEFCDSRVRGVLARREEIDREIDLLLAHWNLDRLGTVERAVLRLGVWEIAWSDVPAPVVINEAIDLANWFSSPKSRTLVNGVLDKFARRSADGK